MLYNDDVQVTSPVTLTTDPFIRVPLTCFLRFFLRSFSTFVLVFLDYIGHDLTAV